MTFREEKRTEPFQPNEIFTVSIALLPVFAPISPAKYIRTHPIRCPKRMAAIPFVKPKGAISVPVNISAIDTAAPNHINPLENVVVFVSFIHTSFLHEQENKKKRNIPVAYPVKASKKLSLPTLALSKSGVRVEVDYFLSACIQAPLLML